MAVEIVNGRPLLPSSLNDLESASLEEGVRNVSKLIEEWNLGQTLFDGAGECLFIAKVSGMTVGIGGVLTCKVVPNALRVSRFYVHPDRRKKGIATAIANKCLAHALEFTEIITCNAQASSIASPFWESLGFSPVDVQGITHILK
ncbi:acetyltransferase (GNAT) family protein [mine drainage metagenome]|uniref:Acetyltransferase (GNAT) family protein n=1 Tax=mine drainage metagenome TaxID=410659 RepID=A0A1J5Q269_9ZZZZ